MQQKIIIRNFKIYTMISLIVLGLVSYKVHQLTQENRLLTHKIQSLETTLLENSQKDQKNPLRVGNKIKDYQLKDVFGTIQTFPHEKKDTLLLVFSTTCHACSNNIPNWKKLIQKASNQNIQVVALSIHNTQSTIEYIKKHQLDIPVISIHQSPEIKNQLQIFKYPQTLLINQQGIVKKIWIGVLAPPILKNFL